MASFLVGPRATPAVSPISAGASSLPLSASLSTPGAITVRPGTLPGLNAGGPAPGGVVGLPRYTPGEAPRLEEGGTDPAAPGPGPGTGSGVDPKPPQWVPGRLVLVQGVAGEWTRGGDGDDHLLYFDSLPRPERFDGGAGHDRLWLCEGGSLGGRDNLAGETPTDDAWVGIEEVRFYDAAQSQAEVQAQGMTGWPVPSPAVATDFAQSALFAAESAPITGLALGTTASLLSIAPVGEVDNRVNLNAQSEPVRVFGGQGLSNRITTGEGDDVLWGGLRSDHLNAFGGHDQLFGMGGSDGLQGGLGHDLLDGGSGDDFLLDSDGVSIGRPDNDTLIGGDGADEIVVWSGSDLVDLREATPSRDKVHLFETPSVFCRLLGFDAGQDALWMSFHTSAYYDRNTGQLGGLEARTGELRLDTTRDGVFYIHHPLQAIDPHAEHPQRALSWAGVQVARPGDRALVVIWESAPGTTASSWVYAVQDLNRDGWIQGAEEMDLMAQAVGVQLLPGDLGW